MNELMNEEGEEAAGLDPMLIALQGLANDLQGRFHDAEIERQPIEQEWLKDLRQYKGIYDPDIAAKIPKNKSKAFVRLTRSKVKTADARAMDMLFPAGTDRNYSIEATPVAEVDPKVHGEIIKALIQDRLEAVMASAEGMDDVTLATAVAAGDMPSPEALAAIQLAIEQGNLGAIDTRLMPDDEEIMKAVQAEAKTRAASMSKEIDDQLTEARYGIVCRDVLHSGHLFGTGILKGPLVEAKLFQTWQQGATPDGQKAWGVQLRKRFRPFVEFVPVWDIYPDQSVSELADGEYVFQRHVMGRVQLRALKNRPDFNGEAIERIIAKFPDGNAQYKNWETDLQNISKDETFKKHENRKRFEVLEFWGCIDGKQLRDCGVEGIRDEDLNQDYEANIWLVGNEIIKVNLNPTYKQTRPYHFYYFEKDDTSIWGTSIPAIHRYPQMIFNGSVRATLDNLAITAGPVWEVNLDLLDPDEKPDDIFAFRILYRRGKDIAAQHPALRAHEVSSRVPELLKVADLAKQLGDETLNLPAYMHGENDKGVGRTVGGLSMLMGAASISMKDVVRNFDDGITKPFITSLYDWNMQFGTNESIKGDYKVSARGSSSLVAKELYGQQLDDFAAKTPPEDRIYLRRYELTKERAQARDLNADVVLKEKPEVEDEMRAEIERLTQENAALLKQVQRTGVMA